MAQQLDPRPLSRLLLDWYRRNKRDLPWRHNRDPYRIWVSEIMLQQTTVVTVIPYYENFMRRFPTLDQLANAPLEDVLERWAGLGYYSRARNLHRAAQALAQVDFPRTYTELSKYPGFGPYTARAVASLAFDEKVGVLDGNVIRVLSRLHGLNLEWWKLKGRARLQALVDELAQCDHPADVNQGLMELGATVCTPTSPACLLCPWVTACTAYATRRIGDLPAKRPRREREIWHWLPQVIRRAGKVRLVENTYAPFLKGHWILPGQVKRLQSPPKKFDYRGSVTHHDIFVTVNAANPALAKKPDGAGSGKWVSERTVAKEIPASLIRKAIDHHLRARPRKSSKES